MSVYRIIFSSYTLPTSFRLNDLPVYIAFYIVPAIGAICQWFWLRQPNYDLLWGASFLFLCLSRGSCLSRWAARLFMVVFAMTMVKYVLPIFWYGNVSLKALAIDYKWICYLTGAALWINFAGKIDCTTLYKAGRNLAAGYSLFVIARAITFGHYSRVCTYLFEECNYVCYLILISYCFIKEMKGGWKDYAIFLLAVFLSDSRTGLASAAVLTAYPYYRKSRSKPLYWIGALIFAIIYVKTLFIARGAADFMNIDRVIYFRQYLYCLKSFSVSEWFLGICPGVSVHADHIVNGFGWVISYFQKKHSIVGCYPFYFHSTYLRMLLVWGLPLCVYGLVRIRKIFRTTRRLPLKLLILLFLIESVSLSTLSLTNVSIIFFMVSITELVGRRK